MNCTDIFVKGEAQGCRSSSLFRCCCCRRQQQHHQQQQSCCWVWFFFYLWSSSNLPLKATSFSRSFVCSGQSVDSTPSLSSTFSLFWVQLKPCMHSAKWHHTQCQMPRSAVPNPIMHRPNSTMHSAKLCSANRHHPFSSHVADYGPYSQTRMIFSSWRYFQITKVFGMTAYTFLQYV